MAKVKMAYFCQNASKKFKFFLVTQNGPGYNKNNKKFESVMLDIPDGMHSTVFLAGFIKCFFLDI
jgi:hypothetical protein